MFKIKIFIILSVGILHSLNGAAAKNAKQTKESLESTASNVSHLHTRSREVEMRALKLLATGTFERLNDSARPNDNRTEVFIQFSHATAGETLSISQWKGRNPALSCERLNKDGKTTTTVADPEALKKECELLDKVHNYFKACDTTKILSWSYVSNASVSRKFKIYEDHTIEHSNS